MTSTVNIGGEDYPVRIDFSSITRILPLFGLKYITQIDELNEKMEKEFPAEAICPFIHNIVRSGLRYTCDDRQPPTIDEIERAVDEDMTLIVRVLEAISDNDAEPAETEKKTIRRKKKATTTKP